MLYFFVLSISLKEKSSFLKQFSVSLLKWRLVSAKRNKMFLNEIWILEKMLDRVHIMWYFITCDEGRHPLMCRHLNPLLHGRLTCRPPGPDPGKLYGQQSPDKPTFVRELKNRQGNVSSMKMSTRRLSSVSTDKAMWRVSIWVSQWTSIWMSSRAI